MTYTVTQEEIDAAQGFGCGFCPDDQDEYLAQAFARHRIETLERAAWVAKAGWVSADYNVVGIADADMAMRLCEHIETEIRALKGKSDE